MKSTPSALVLGTVLLSAACGGGSTRPTASARQPAATADIGPAGGVVLVTNAASPLHGLRLEVPPGALSETKRIEVFPPSGLPALAAGAVPVAAIEPSGTVFRLPARLTLPYPDRDQDGLVDGLGFPEDKLIGLETGGNPAFWRERIDAVSDPTRNTMSFDIGHLSGFGYSGLSPKLDPGQLGVFLWEPTPNHGFTPDERRVIAEAVMRGGWRPLTRCSGHNFVSASSRATANVVVRWATTPELEAEIRRRGGTGPVPRGWLGHSFPRDRLDAFKQWTIFLRKDPNNPTWHVAIRTTPPPGTDDLYAVVLHEMAHAYGLPRDDQVAYDPPGSIIHGNSRNPPAWDLTCADENFFLYSYPVVFSKPEPVVFSGNRPGVAVEIETTCRNRRAGVCPGVRPPFGVAIALVSIRSGQRMVYGPRRMLLDGLAPKGSKVRARHTVSTDLGPGAYTVLVLAESTRPVGLRPPPAAGPARDIWFWPLEIVDCNSFPPPPGERHTYRVVGGSETFTTVTQKVEQRVGGHVVYGIWRTDSPPGMREYIGCDAKLGEVAVATNWWLPNDPKTWGTYFWQPPLFSCPFGTPAGRKCRPWIGKFAGKAQKEVTDVLGYVDVQVPFGLFRSAMKARISTFEGAGRDPTERITVWADRSVGIVRAEDDDTHAAIELVGYSPGGTTNPSETRQDHATLPSSALLSLRRHLAALRSR